MVVLPVSPAEFAAPGLAVTCKFIVPVNEFACLDVYAASWTAFSGVTGGAVALEPELVAQPVTAAATITASPAAYRGDRAIPACIKTSSPHPALIGRFLAIPAYSLIFDHIWYDVPGVVAYHGIRLTPVGRTAHGPPA
jgi:hypothetical protein